MMTDTEFALQKRRALTVGYTPYATFHNALKGYTIIDRKTGEEVPKFMIWRRCGCRISEKSVLFTSRLHKDFDFIPKAK